jgi:3-hydroxyisobutyrate dehydrogenase-like beta-hydroxyacid dehydrogenase
MIAVFHQRLLTVGNIIISFGHLSVAFEAMTLRAKAGFDPEQILEVINTTSDRNSATETNISNHGLIGDFDHGGEGRRCIRCRCGW